MSTCGAWGIRRDGVDKLVYVETDAYPRVLGRTFTHLVADIGREGLSKVFDALTPDHDDTRLPGGSTEHYDWFPLSRKAAIGELDQIPYFPANDFMENSLWCEHGYIANLDTDKLEIWIGMQKLPDPNNRYGQTGHPAPGGDHTPYYPCRMIQEFDFSIITPLYADRIAGQILQ